MHIHVQGGDKSIFFVQTSLFFSTFDTIGIWNFLNINDIRIQEKLTHSEKK